MSDNIKNTSENIYPDFSSWIVPNNISLDREEFKLRWKTISRLFISEKNLNIENSWVENLIKSALGYDKLEPEILEGLKEEIRVDDDFFNINNNEEIKVLSSYALRLLIDDEIHNNYYCSPITIQILAASLDSMKKYKGGNDLFDFTLNKSFHYTRELRKRTEYNKINKISKLSDSYNETIESLKENEDVDFDVIENVLSELTSELLNQISNINNEFDEYIKESNFKNNQLSEEQEILWLITISWSDKLNSHYSDLSESVKIIDFTKSISDHTYIRAELPSIKALASKVGIIKNNISFRNFVQDSSLVYSDLINEYDNVISVLTPCLYAIKLSNQGSWYKKWKEDIGIDSNFEIDTLNLTQQIYREFLVLKWKI